MGIYSKNTKKQRIMLFFHQLHHIFLHRYSQIQRIVQMDSGEMPWLFEGGWLLLRLVLRINQPKNEPTPSFLEISGRSDILHRLRVLCGLEMLMVLLQNEAVMDSIVLLESGSHLWNLLIKIFQRKIGKSQKVSIHIPYRKQVGNLLRILHQTHKKYLLSWQWS